MSGISGARTMTEYATVLPPEYRTGYTAIDAPVGFIADALATQPAQPAASYEGTRVVAGGYYGNTSSVAMPEGTYGDASSVYEGGEEVTILNSNGF